MGWNKYSNFNKISGVMKLFLPIFFEITKCNIFKNYYGIMDWTNCSNCRCNLYGHNFYIIVKKLCNIFH